MQRTCTYDSNRCNHPCKRPKDELCTCMCPKDELVQVGDRNIIYRTESRMKAIYEEMERAPNRRIQLDISKQHSVHPVEVSENIQTNQNYLYFGMA